MATQNFYASGLNPDPGFLAICRGLLEGFKPIIRNGVNPDIDSGAAESIWDQGGLYVFPPSATVMQVSSTSANDTSAGTGARTVLVSGLDADYLPITETVTLSGQTQVATVAQFLRIHGIVTATAGSLGQNAGDVYVGTGAAVGGVPPAVYSRARPGWNASQQIQYTVPAGNTAYIVNTFTSATGSALNQSTLISLRRRFFDSGLFVRSGSVVAGGQAVDSTGNLYTRVPEKTDIDAVCETTDNNVIVAAQFRILLVPGVDNPA
jgi:hypothetical protein